MAIHEISLSTEEIVHKYSDMIYRLAFAKTGNSHDAEDITQEVFLKLINSQKKGKTFNDEEHRKAWLIRVTVNLAINTVKSSNRLTDFDESVYGALTSEPCGNDDFSRIETKSVVMPAVLSLPEKYRIVIHLYYYEGLSVAEIEKVTGLGENTVKSRLLRARGKLKEILKEVDFND
jgi:RNA polymerase sigma-70 factor (ECF subfamily)